MRRFIRAVYGAACIIVRCCNNNKRKDKGAWFADTLWWCNTLLERGADVVYSEERIVVKNSDRTFRAR